MAAEEAPTTQAVPVPAPVASLKARSPPRAEITALLLAPAALAPSTAAVRPSAPLMLPLQPVVAMALAVPAAGSTLAPTVVLVVVVPEVV